MSTIFRVQHVSVPMPPGGEADARRFYAETLGLVEKDPPSTIKHLNLVWFNASADGQEIHIYTDNEFSPAKPRQHFCVQVDDLDGIRQRLTEGGYDIVEVPIITNRPRFNTNDPFGNSIEITTIEGEYD